MHHTNRAIIFFQSAGRDFVFVNTSLTFSPGDTVGSPARCVNITILNDEVVEAAETFDVVVSSNSILQINGTTSITVTINEDPTDCEPLLFLLRLLTSDNVINSYAHENRYMNVKIGLLRNLTFHD